MSLDIWLTAVREVEITHQNATHNLTPMWREAGVYDALYNSEGDLAEIHLETLKKGLDDMREHPDKYKALNPPNGWGTYEGAVKFLQAWVNVCRENPDAKIHIWK